MKRFLTETYLFPSQGLAFAEVKNMRQTVIEWAYKEKIIAIVRGIEPEKCLKVAQALYDGGIRMMEITYDQRNPASWETTAQSIGEIAKAFAGKMLVGAGTVTTVELVELTHKAGGLFIISPNTNAAVIRRTRELGMVSMPGIFTPTEAANAHRAGADFVKLFPNSEMKVSYLKCLVVPLSHIKFLAVGGVNADTIKTYLDAGAAGVGVATSIVNKQLIAEGKYDEITKLALAHTQAAGIVD